MPSGSYTPSDHGVFVDCFREIIVMNPTVTPADMMEAVFVIYPPLHP
jgi:hypothetical protein